MKGKQYDYKEAYNKNLTPKARLHYLENARHDQDAPTNMCSPNHYDSPAKQVVDPLAQPQMVQPMTNVTPAGSSLVNPFSPQAQANAQGVFGNQQMKQNAVGAPAMYKDGSPLEGNAFIGAKMAAEKAGKDTFEVGGKTFQVK
tara:strand:- start:713 stop:1141 length:429 start_codon:yes stop_codon:yes gene_type:complete